MPAPLTTKTKVRLAEATDRALTMRLAGAKYREIGAELGVTPERARQYVARAIEAIPRESADALKKQELERLDTDWQRLEKKLVDLQNVTIKGGIDAYCALMNQRRKIQDQRAKYEGLYAPVQTEHHGDPLVVVTLEDIDATRATIEHNLRAAADEPAAVH